MRRLILFLLAVCLCAVAVYAANTSTSGLVVYDVKWKQGWPDPYFPSVADFWPTGKLRNDSKQFWRYIRVTCSVFECRTNEKLPITPTAVMENVRAGDKCQWTAYPGHEMKIGQVNCYVRIEKVEGWNPKD